MVRSLWLMSVIRLIAKAISKDEVEASPFTQESIFRMYTLLNRLSDLVESGILNIDTLTLQRLITQIVSATSIPFHGEPIEGIQMMGVLETRNIDFDHVLLLSCNEGPKGLRTHHHRSQGSHLCLLFPSVAATCQRHHHRL